ncbi:hypothetical protein QOT17_006004 [Balamuthia mandrillaris]
MMMSAVLNIGTDHPPQNFVSSLKRSKPPSKISSSLIVWCMRRDDYVVLYPALCTQQSTHKGQRPLPAGYKTTCHNPALGRANPSLSHNAHKGEIRLGWFLVCSY